MLKKPGKTPLGSSIMESNITAKDFAELKKYYFHEEQMRKMPGSREANARFAVVLEQCQKKFEYMVDCKNNSARLKKFNDMAAQLELYKIHVANIEQNIQHLSLDIQNDETLMNIEYNYKPKGIKSYLTKITTLIHIKQHSTNYEEYRKKIGALNEKQKHLLELQQDKENIIKLMQPIQEFFNCEIYKVDSIKLENNKVNCTQIIKEYNEWKGKIEKELKGCLTEEQLSILYRYFYKNMSFSDSYIQYTKKMQLNNQDTQFCKSITANLSPSSILDSVKDIELAIKAYQIYKSYINNKHISQYSFQELEGFMAEICRIGRILISHGMFTLEELKREEHEIWNDEEDIAAYYDTSYAGTTSEAEISGYTYHTD